MAAWAQSERSNRESSDKSSSQFLNCLAQIFRELSLVLWLQLRCRANWWSLRKYKAKQNELIDKQMEIKGK